MRTITPNLRGGITPRPSRALRLVGASSQSLATPTGLSLAPNAASFTVAAWFCFSSYGAYNTLLGRWRFGTSLCYSLRNNWTTPTLAIGTGINTESYVAAASAVTADEWHLAVGWYSQPESKVYIQVDNGTPASVSIGFTPGSSASDWTSVGQSGNNDEFFTGHIGPCGFWSRLLGSAERSMLYNGGVGRTYSQLSPQHLAGLVSYWDLDEAGGTRRDAHGANHLTPTNAPVSGPGRTLPDTRRLLRVPSAASAPFDADSSLAGGFVTLGL